MKRALLFLLALISLPAVAKAELTDKEMTALVNSINKRVAVGDATSLDEVKVLPTDNKMAALLLFFRSGFNIYKRTPQQLACAQKAAKMLTETAGAEKWLKDLFAPQPAGAKKPAYQRGVAIDCLAEANNKFSIRVLCEGLSAMDLGNQRSEILRAFLKMDIPSPPYPKTLYPAKEPKGSTGQEGLAKWQKWWEQHKAEYPEQSNES